MDMTSLLWRRNVVAADEEWEVSKLGSGSRDEHMKSTSPIVATLGFLYFVPLVEWIWS